MRDAGQSDIQTVTLAFEEFQGSENDEAGLAAEVAKTYGTRHTKRVVNRHRCLFPRQPEGRIEEGYRAKH